jgi:hypothetical protein
VAPTVVDVGDDIGTIHYHLYGMQSNTDNACVDHVKLEDELDALSVQFHSLGVRFELFIINQWTPFQTIILNSLTTTTSMGQACLQSHMAYQPPPPSLT